MFSEKKEKFLINIVLVLFIVGITCCFTLFPLLSESVSAEELTNNSILDFNQLLNVSRNFNITSTTTDRKQHYASSLTNFDPTHKYFIGNNSNSDLVFLTIVRYNAGSYVSYSDFSTNSIYYNNGTYNQVVFQINTAGVVSGTFNFMVVDLTQCFGAGNEPTSVAEFKSYFANDYYSYTLSTLVPLDATTSYSQGYTDGITSFSVVTAADDIYNSSYYSGGEPTDSLVVNDTAPYFQKLVYQTQTDKPNVYLIFPMINTIPADSNFSINGYINSYVYDTTGTLNIYAFINNKDYISLGTISFSGTTPKEFNINVNVPFSVSNIAFISSNSLCVLGDVAVTYKISNLQKLAQDNFNAGRDSVDIDSIKSQAFNKGKQAGIDSANKYTFSALVSSVVDAPIKAITGLLNFEIFGVNLKSFMLSLFTIAVVIAIVKLFLGNVGGSSAK